MGGASPAPTKTQAARFARHRVNGTSKQRAYEGKNATLKMGAWSTRKNGRSKQRPYEGKNATLKMGAWGTRKNGRSKQRPYENRGSAVRSSG